VREREEENGKDIQKRRHKREVGFALQFAFGVILIVVKFHEFFGREYFVKYFMK